MKDIRLTLHEWLNYLIPGSILTFTLHCLFLKSNNLFFYEFPPILSPFISGFVLFCISYMLGHLIHSLSNYSIDLLPYGKYAPEEYFSKEFNIDFPIGQIDLLVSQISIKQNINQSTIQDKTKFIKENYWYCFSYVSNQKENPLCLTFLNLNRFYRGMTIGNFISGLITIVTSGINYEHSSSIIFGLILFFSSFIFYSRAVRFKCYLTKTVYTDYLSQTGTV